MKIKHGLEECCQGHGIHLVHLVLFDKHRLEWPHLEFLDVPQLASLGEELAAVLASES
jgi:hypothetical protein